jgi:hypothetical protein
MDMRKLGCAALLALACAGMTAQAAGICPPFKVECGCNAYLRAYCPTNGSPAQCGPWYLYWPLEAHFQTPAMPCYPTWPSPMGLPPSAGVSPPPAPPVAAPPGLPAPTMQGTGALKPADFHQSAFQPVGYYQQVPGYWYGR